MTLAGWSRRDAGWFLLALAGLVATIGVRHLAVPDEGRYASAAWEMLASGNWLYPTLDGLPFLHKPPLYYWITSASFAAFGLHEWASRLAPALGAAVAGFAIYGFALRRASRPVARLALLVLFSMPLLFGSAQFSNMDMLVGGFISATTLLAGEAAIDAAAGVPRRGLLAGAYLCAALGVLTKGLMGAALPGLSIVAWLLWNRRPGLLLRLLWWPGIGLFLLVTVPWFVAMQAHFAGFLHYFFVDQQFERYSQGGFNNPEPAWFYLAVLAGGLLPWSLLLPTALRGNAPAGPGPSARSLMWCAAAAIVLFFSLPASKMPGYVLGAVPPLAYLVADGAGRRWPDLPRFPRALRWFAGIAIATCLALPFAVRLSGVASNASLAQRIAAQRQPGEPVYFVKYQFLDVPFYLRLTEPVPIFDDWQQFRASRAGRTDDWRQTMVDAAKFDPQRARLVLAERSTLARVLCSQPVAWSIAKKVAAATTAPLAKLSPTFTVGDRAVYRTVAGDLMARGLCPQMPSDGSPGTSGPPPPPAR